MNMKEIKALIKLCKKNQISRIKCGEIEIDFENAVKRKKIVPPDLTEIPIIGDKMPADDEMLFYSAGAQLEEIKKS